MYKVAFVLACVGRVGHGRRVQPSIEKLQSGRFSEFWRTSKAFNPSAAFTAPALGARLPVRNPTMVSAHAGVLGMQRRFGHHTPELSTSGKAVDTSADNPADHGPWTKAERANEEGNTHSTPARSGFDRLPAYLQQAAFAGTFAALVGSAVGINVAYRKVQHARPTWWWDATETGAALLLGAIFMTAGRSHFTMPEVFTAIYPPQGTWGFWYLPGSAEFHVAWTGIAEICGGAGLLFGGLLGVMALVEWNPFGVVEKLGAFCRLHVLPISAGAMFLLVLSMTPADFFIFSHDATIPGFVDGPLPATWHVVRFVAQVMILGTLLSLSSVRRETMVSLTGQNMLTPLRTACSKQRSSLPNISMSATEVPQESLRSHRQGRSRARSQSEVRHQDISSSARAELQDLHPQRARSEEASRSSRRERSERGDRFESTPSGNRKEEDNRRGSNGKRKLSPLPRPGYDEDDRLEKLDDDPRYFPGADLGKAQKAALGIQGLTGRNTASFDPRSTLVRPAMRIYYGEAQEQYEKAVNLDDVVIVPDFFCPEDDFEALECLSEELDKCERWSTDIGELEYMQDVISKMCQYFSIEEAGRAVCVIRYKDNADASPLATVAGDFGERFSEEQNCLAILAFGSLRELAFRRSMTDELLFFPLSNGALSLFGRDACLRFQHGMNMTPQSEASHGHITIAIKGRSSLAVEETKLAIGPGDRDRKDPFDGRGDWVCRDILRPSLRIITAPPRERYSMPVKHDDVIVVPEFFCTEDDWEIYYQLLKEMRESQAAGESKAEWVSWHEGAHLLSQNPTGSETYQRVLDKMCDYFSIGEQTRGTRFNWYRDGSDWKPFHHDSAAFNAKRAKNQNCTIGVSFGASRELAFRHAKTGELLYFPQKNGMLFYFGRDANIMWQHGINALPDDEQDGKGRISIILWGLCTTTVEEEGSPPMLTNETRDGGKGKGKGKPDYDHRRDQPCRDFLRGNCSYGDRCKFSHSV